jgi:hypothetical protein
VLTQVWAMSLNNWSGDKEASDRAGALQFWSPSFPSWPDLQVTEAHVCSKASGPREEDMAAALGPSAGASPWELCKPQGDFGLPLPALMFSLYLGFAWDQLCPIPSIRH